MIGITPGGYIIDNNIFNYPCTLSALCKIVLYDYLFGIEMYNMFVCNKN